MPSNVIAATRWINAANSSLPLQMAALVLFAVAMLPLGSCSGAPDRSTPSPEDEARGKAANEIVDAKVVAEMNIKSVLKDSDTAKFKEEIVSRLSSGTYMLCGKVNSKNSFGAFTGYKRFISSPSPSAPSMVEGENTGIGEISAKDFAKAWSFACSKPVERF